MKKTRLPKHFTPIAVGAGLLLLVLVGWFGFVHPQKTEAAKVDEEIAAVEKQVQEYRTLAHSKSAEAAVKLADVFRLTKAMPDGIDMPGIILELNRLAGQSGISFQAISPAAQVSVQGYRVVPVDGTFEGTYYEISDFLYRLRNLVEVHQGRLATAGRLFTVDKVHLAEGQKHFPSLTATLTVDAYVYGSSAAGTVGTDTTGTTSTPSSTDTTSTTTTTTSAPAAPEGATAAGVSP